MTTVFHLKRLRFLVLLSIILWAACFQPAAVASRNGFQSFMDQEHYTPPETHPPAPDSAPETEIVSSSSSFPFVQKPRNTRVPASGMPAPGDHLEVLEDQEDYPPPQTDPPAPHSAPDFARAWTEIVTSSSSFPFVQKPRNTRVPPSGMPAPGDHLEVLEDQEDYPPPQTDPPAPHSAPDFARTWTEIVTSSSSLPFVEKPRNTRVPPSGMPAPGDHFVEKPRNTRVPPSGMPAPGDHFVQKPRNTRVPPSGMPAPGDHLEGLLDQEDYTPPQTHPPAPDSVRTWTETVISTSKRPFVQKPRNTPVAPSGSPAPDTFFPL